MNIQTVGTPRKRIQTRAAKESKVRWAASNPKRAKAVHKAWRDRNRVKLRARDALRRANDPEGERARIRGWGILNRDKSAEKSARRRAVHKLATPAWANRRYINLWYEHAQFEQERTGKRCQVDHIVPLCSERVCGLHNEFNLQVLFGPANEAKGNRDWPDNGANL